MPKPPEAVTGVKLAAAAFTAKVVDATTCDVVSVDAVTAKLNVLNEVCAVGVEVSVAVTVKVVAANRLVGVPLMAPVAVAKLRPVGRAPPDRA